MSRYDRTRHAVITREAGLCQRCPHPTPGRYVHHLDRRGWHGPRAHDLTNLELLCKACHQDEHLDDRGWPPRKG